jgi:hypothetical protein
MSYLYCVDHGVFIDMVDEVKVASFYFSFARAFNKNFIKFFFCISG